METLPVPTPSQQSPSSGLAHYSTSLQMELAKCLQLVVPASMTADDRAAWLMAAVDALEDIRAEEVAHVSAELRRSVTRPAQIVPEIARLVAERRQSRASSQRPSSPYAIEMKIDREGRERRAKARNQTELEAAWQWERSERQKNELPVPPIEPPLTAKEIGKMTPMMISLGLKTGALIRQSDGTIVDSTRAA